MQEFIINNYLWFRAFHVIAVISWMVGLLYLPRLFVYHVNAGHDSDLSKSLKIMERKLFKVIMNPAMIFTWLFGVLMFVGNPDLFKEGWIHVKLLAVILMSVIHMIFGKWRKVFARDHNKRSHKFYRVWNEVPAVLMVIIVIMAIVEPL